MLAHQKCTACNSQTPVLSADAVAQYLDQLHGWHITSEGYLHQRFSFNDFAQSLAFVNRVAAVAEDAGHHPDISFGWGYCDIHLHTHTIHGLHDNDFILAAKIDQLLKEDV